ncbi:MAG: erythromycin biosynthesis sensory transduction protein eryC1 [Ignavibacteria bacterium RBG_16_34_14]|nr:MAG: erythromycin biosynthesis sensory transduction protein eryC1 [Ignavibacteria bacterium RBG_16_34_14]
MQVPFLDLKIQYQSIKNEINPAIQNILDNTSFILGKVVFDFENTFAKAHNVKHCFGVSSGTDGNHLASWALGIGAGDEIIVPANTFVATAWGATLTGAKPVFADCDSISYNIDPNKLGDAVTSKTKAVVAVHLYGQPADIESISKITKDKNLSLIEDCAQAHLAEYKNKKVGGLSDIACFSFYPGKNLGAYGEAGAVTTNNDELANKVKMYRDHGALQKYHHESLGHNYRMDGIQGAVLGVKMKYIEKWTDGRRIVAAKYKELLCDLGDIILPTEMSYAKHVYHLYVIQVRNGGAEKRDSLTKFLNKNGIATGLHYPIPLHLQKCFSDLKYKKGDFPVSEKLAESGLSLPMYPELSDNQIEYVAEKIKEFFNK